MKRYETEDTGFELKPATERLLQGIMALAVIVACLILYNGISANAAEDYPVKLVSIDYYTSTLTLNMGADNTYLYMSDAKQKKWEFVPVVKDSSNYVTVDFSWVSEAKNTVLTFKGDLSNIVLSVTIPGRLSNLKVKYNSFTGLVSFTNLPEDRTIQWKKKEAFFWQEYNEATFEDEINSMVANGASLLFRIAPVNGTAFDPGARASKEVALTIPKKTAAPVIKIDDEMLAIPLANGMEYRYADEYGNPLSTEWTRVNKTAYRLLFSANLGNEPLAPLAAADQETRTAGQDVYLQFRSARTTNSQVSNVTTIKIPGQKPLSDTEIEGCELIYTSSTTFSIKIAAASITYPYEYLILSQSDITDGVTIDSFEDIAKKWVKVTSPEPVAISADKKVKDGSKVYVRRAAYLTLGEDDYSVASPAYCLCEAINYPGTISNTEGVTVLQTVAGVCEPSNPSGYLQPFTYYSPTETVISKITFVDYTSRGTNRGTLTLSGGDFKSSVALNADSSDPDRKYIITTTIMDTSDLDKFADSKSTRCMVGYITLKDSGDEFKGDDENAIILYIHPATTVNNPSTENACKETATLLSTDYPEWTGYNYALDKVKYTDDIVRIVDSIRTYENRAEFAGIWDASTFRIRLDIGTRYVPERNTKGEFTDEKVEVIKIKYDGIEFTPGTPGNPDTAFYVEYADTESDTAKGSEEIRMAVLTINTEVIEGTAAIDERNNKAPVIIYLSNGEVLKKALTLDLRETATIDDGTQSWSIIAGSLTEVDTTTETSSGGSQVTTTKKHIDRTISLTEYSGIEGVSLVSVTWSDGVTDYPVCSNIKHSGHTYTMDMDNAVINRITVPAGSTVAGYLTFTFDNGFKIKTGWKLIITGSRY